MNELCYNSAAEFSPCFKYCGVTRRVRKEENVNDYPIPLVHWQRKRWNEQDK